MSLGADAPRADRLERTTSELRLTEPSTGTQGQVEIPSEWELLPQLTELERSESKGRKQTMDSSTAEAVTLRGRVLTEDIGLASAGESPIIVLASPHGQAAQFEVDASAELCSVNIARPEQADGSLSFAVTSPGREVQFENNDEICHNFFSTSGANAFELGTQDPHESRSHVFQQPGSVQVYCSLHAGKQMNIMVVPTPYYALVEPDGYFELPGLAPGVYHVEAWSAEQRSRRLRIEVSGDEDAPLMIPIDDVTTEEHE